MFCKKGLPVLMEFQTYSVPECVLLVGWQADISRVLTDNVFTLQKVLLKLTLVIMQNLDMDVSCNPFLFDIWYFCHALISCYEE